MIRQEEVYKIGRIGKTHGVKGEVTLHFTDDIFDRADADYLVIEIDGILVPFFMEEYRFRSDTVALIKFCDIDTQEQAAQLTGSDVFFPRHLAADAYEELSWSALAGYELVDAETQQTVGKIAHVDDTTLNILFELEDGRLIPASNELIVQVDSQRQIIEITLPDGILEL